MTRKTRQYTNPFLKGGKSQAAPVVPPQPDLQRAVGLHQQGDLVQAQAIYRQILEIDPRNPDALYLLGVIAYQNGNNQQAVELYDKAIELKSDYAEAYSNRGIALKKLKQLSC